MPSYSHLRSHPALVPVPTPAPIPTSAQPPLLARSQPTPSLLPPPPTISSTHNFPRPALPLHQPLPDPAGRHHLYV